MPTPRDTPITGTQQWLPLGKAIGHLEAPLSAAWRKSMPTYVKLLRTLSCPIPAKGPGRFVQHVWAAECRKLLRENLPLAGIEEPDWDGICMQLCGWNALHLLRSRTTPLIRTANALETGIQERFSVDTRDSCETVHRVWVGGHGARKAPPWENTYRIRAACAVAGRDPITTMTPEVVTCTECKALAVEQALV